MATAMRFGDLRRLVGLVHALPHARDSAIEARLKNMMRLGFPVTDAVGSGERAEYRAEQVLQFLLAFELLRFRMPPAAVVHIVTAGWPRACAAFAAAARDVMEGTVPTAARRGDLLVVDALALHEPGKTVVAADILSTLEVESAGDVAAGIGSAAGRSMLLLDPRAILDAAVGMMPSLRRPVDTRFFLQDVAGMRRPQD